VATNAVIVHSGKGCTMALLTNNLPTFYVYSLSYSFSEKQENTIMNLIILKHINLIPFSQFMKFEAVVHMEIKKKKKKEDNSMKSTEQIDNYVLLIIIHVGSFQLICVPPL
jgi:hypothetical protein